MKIFFRASLQTLYIYWFGFFIPILPLILENKYRTVASVNVFFNYFTASLFIFFYLYSGVLLNIYIWFAFCLLLQIFVADSFRTQIQKKDKKENSTSKFK